MPRNYGGLMYRAGRLPGAIVGQGLIGLGQGVSGGIREHERKEEKKQATQLKKSQALINVYTQMLEQIKDPSQRLKLITGTIAPIMVSSGMLPENYSKEEFARGIASMATADAGYMKRFREATGKIDKLIDDGEPKKAKKAIRKLRETYVNIDGIGAIADGYAKTAEAEIKGAADLEKEKRGVTNKAKQSVAEGKTGLVPPGTKGSVKWGGLNVKSIAETVDDSKTKHTIPGMTRKFTYKEMATAMKNIAQNLKEQTKDNDLDFLDPVKIKYDEDGKAYLDADAKAKTVIEKIKDYAENSKSKEVRAMAKKYMAFAETLEWFAEEPKKPKAGAKRKETPKELIDRMLGVEEGVDSVRRQLREEEDQSAKRNKRSSKDYGLLPFIDRFGR